MKKTLKMTTMMTMKTRKIVLDLSQNLICLLRMRIWVKKVGINPDPQLTKRKTTAENESFIKPHSSTSRITWMKTMRWINFHFGFHLRKTVCGSMTVYLQVL